METNSNQWIPICFLETKIKMEMETNSQQRELIMPKYKLRAMHAEIKTGPENNTDDNLALRIICFLSNESSTCRLRLLSATEADC